jgi:zinc transport system substrate-binding protein
MFGCSKKSENNLSESDISDKLSVVCTTFPQYDWVREILGDKADSINLTLLLDNGMDLHSYQPTAEDIAKIADCDVFIYVGGESDGWVEDALAEATNKDMQVINLMEVVGDTAKEEEVIEGMEVEETEEGDDEEIEYDEHVWLSLKNAELICNSICTSISTLDADNSEFYKKNLETYIDRLSALDSDYKKTVDNSVRSTVLFGDRFPFRYMVDDYGLDYYAAFVGCSAETEASFKTVLFLAEKIDELDLPAICVIESSDQSIAKTIINNTENKDQKILVMDSMQSVTSEDVVNGTDYISIMESNLEVLKEALS